MNSTARNFVQCAAICASVVCGSHAHANRVTIITHGFGADVDEWVLPLANRMAGYTEFWGTQSSCYKINLSAGVGGGLVITSQFLDGVPANTSNSGNIFIKLDWTDVAGYFNSIIDFEASQYDVSQIATVVVPALMDETLISDLGGRSLAEFPLHLIGHSRGGSLVTEIARELGQSGIWVDHITTMDPHPCDPSNNTIEAFGCPVNDATPVLYENVFFADNFWQNGAYPEGQTVPGAYNRYFPALPNGYGSPHSNTHLWYHGTIDFTSPVTTDTSANLTDTDRLTWFEIGETNGTWSGYLNSYIGGGDRLSEDRPAGPTTPPIQDGVVGSRTALPSNDGTWPNLITFNAMNEGRFLFRSEPGLAVREENVLIANTSLNVSGDYQSGESANVEYFLDPDANSLNGNEIQIGGELLDATGVTTVSNIVRTLDVESATVSNGVYFLGVDITSTPSGMIRTIYAPQKIAVLEPLLLSIQQTSQTGSQISITGSAGYDAVVEASGTFSGWNPVATSSFEGASVGDADTVQTQVLIDTAMDFFRARYSRPEPEN